MAVLVEDDQLGARDDLLVPLRVEECRRLVAAVVDEGRACDLLEVVVAPLAPPVGPNLEVVRPVGVGPVLGAVQELGDEERVLLHPVPAPLVSASPARIGIRVE